MSAFFITLLIYSSYFSPTQTQYPKGILRLFFIAPSTPYQLTSPSSAKQKQSANQKIEPNPKLIFPMPSEKLTPLPRKTDPNRMSGEKPQRPQIDPALTKRSGSVKPKTPEEYYLIDSIIPAINYTESYFQEKNGRPMNADDWLRFLNKIYPTTVNFSPTKTEENKITYLKSIAVAYAFIHRGYNYQPKKVKIQINCPSEGLRDALGESFSSGDTINIKCPQYGLSSLTTNVVIHEFLHIMTGMGDEGENIINTAMTTRFPSLFINPEDSKKNKIVVPAPVEFFPKPIYIPFDLTKPPK